MFTQCVNASAEETDRTTRYLGVCIETIILVWKPLRDCSRSFASVDLIFVLKTSIFTTETASPSTATALPRSGSIRATFRILWQRDIPRYRSHISMPEYLATKSREATQVTLLSEWSGM